jgi:hypothetical protein
LQARHTRLARLHVENPVYELITITCHVQIKPCNDPFFYRQQLHADLNLFLAPWLGGESSRLQLGGSLHLSMVVQFMEELPYVAHVEQVQLLHTSAAGAMLNSAQPQWAIATTSRSILTTSDHHQIILLNT